MKHLTITVFLLLPSFNSNACFLGPIEHATWHFLEFTEMVLFCACLLTSALYVLFSKKKTLQKSAIYLALTVTVAIMQFMGVFHSIPKGFCEVGPDLSSKSGIAFFLWFILLMNSIYTMVDGFSRKRQRGVKL